MSRCRLAVVALVAIAVCSAPIGRAGAGRRQAFRASADAVIVDVAVLDRTVAVSGLKTGDFDLRDDGVRQSIVDLSYGTVPLTVVLLADASESMDLRLGEPGAEPGIRQRLPREVDELQRRLRPEDTLDAYRCASGLSRMSGRATFDADPDAERQQTAIFDCVSTLLLEPQPTGRRRLLVVLTDGLDTASVVPRVERLAVLDHSATTVYIVLMAAVRESAPAFGPGRTFADYAWIVDELAQHTGGKTFTVGNGKDETDKLIAAVDDFRMHYLLSYMPTGVPSSGWHKLSVTVPGRPYEVHARPGYWR